MKQSCAAVWRGSSPIRRAAMLGAAASAACAGWVCAQSAETNPPLNFYGSPGLLEMPSAHMSPDGSFNLWASGTGFTQRYGFTFQALPWFEGSFRYIGTKNLFNAGATFSGGTYYDRSFSMRLRLQDETDGWPDIALGINDLIGTGLEGAEYIAASKHIGTLDFTLGMGWGRLAGTGMFENPLAVLFPSFATRPSPTGLVSTSGLIDFKQLFHGPRVSLFGGIAWQTPIDGLTALAEYSSDNYRIESQQHVFTPATQFNFGVAYQSTPSVQLGAAWMYGRTPMVRLAVNLNPKTEPFTQRLGAAPIAPNIRSDAELSADARRKLINGALGVQSLEADGNTLVALMKSAAPPGAGCSDYTQLIGLAHEKGFQELAVSDANDSHGGVRFCPTGRNAETAQQTLSLVSWANSAQVPDTKEFAHARARTMELGKEQGLDIEAIGIHDSQVTVAFTNSHYRTESEAYGRLARVLMAAMPPEVETFRIVSLAGGAPTRELVVPRSSLERTVEQGGAGSELLPVIATDETNLSPDQFAQREVAYPTFDWSILPEYNQSLFDPNQPYLFQLLGGLKGGINVTREFRLEGEAQVNLVSNFNQLLPSDSQLPHVRSDANLYYDKGSDGVAELQGSYTTTLAPGLYGLARGGILESMFAGAGGEILWRPEADRWALGATLYEVWQRGFDRLFDLQAYHVLTGHVSVYYESPWYNLDFEADAGRYLAGDTGGTLTISRRFETGVEIGLFATLTNVPFAKFGEGSFDKGFVIKVPLDFLVPLNSQSEFDMNLRPVTRDGGQMLQPEQVLYDEIRRTGYGEFVANVDQIPSP